MKKICCVITLIVGIIFMTGAVAVADCPDTKMVCAKIANGSVNTNSEIAGYFMAGQCWKQWGCELCSSRADLAKQCTINFSGCANYACAACHGYLDAKGIAGYCYDANGNRLY